MNSTELINYTLDQQFAYDIKLYLLLIFAIYALWGLWYFKDYQPQYLYQWYFQIITRVVAKVYFAILPLWLFFLSRTVPIDVILQPTLIFYGVAGMLFIAFLFLIGGEKIKKFFTGEGFYRNRK